MAAAGADRGTDGDFSLASGGAGKHRLATLAQAIRRTKPTAPTESAEQGERHRPSHRAGDHSDGFVLIHHLGLAARNCSPAMTMLALAESKVAPGLRRRRRAGSGLDCAIGSACKGMKMSAGSERKVAAEFLPPCRIAASRIGLPTSDGSLPKRVRQKIVAQDGGLGPLG